MLSTTEEYGTVIKTEPERNSEVDTDTVITIYFASDEDLVVMQKVVGWDIEMAKAIIESMELTVAPDIKEENSDRPAGEVISQSPEEGEKVIPGSKVTLVVSNGIPASSVANLKISLPASGGTRGNFEVFVNNESILSKTLLLDGSTYAFDIEGSGSDAAVKVYIDNKEYYSCTVDFTKSPAVVSNGTYSSGTASSVIRKSMPSVQGLSMESAVSQLRASGFTNIEIQNQIVYTDAENGKVLSQSPSPSSSSIIGMATTYPTDTKIILVVGQKEGI